jgi:SAM-dependent methyltransferase
VEPAEQVSLRSGACDLVTVAVAVHWFDLDRFYAEVRRVLKPAGVLAVWTYHLPSIAPPVDAVIDRYYHQTLAGHWPERFHYVDERYQTLPFPFAPQAPPDFTMRAEWRLDQLAGFLASWSAAQRYQQAHGRHPLEEVWPALTAAWGAAAQPRPIHWTLHLRLGRTPHQPPHPPSRPAL